MHVNTSVVKALMHLRGIDEASLCNLVSVPFDDMQAWLYDLGENSEERVSLSTQHEVLSLLGVRGETLRSDIVHYWRIHEPLFSRSSTTYWALQIVLKAFGRAQAVFLARESDPSFTLQARAHFGLRFQDFLVILEVTAHPLRNISFDPSEMADLSWVPDTFGVLLPDAEYDRLQPGAMKTRGLTQYLTYSAEMRQWEQLREAAMEKGLRADQVASLLLGNVNPAVAVEHSPSEPDLFSTETEAVAPAAAPTAAAAPEKIVPAAPSPVMPSVAAVATAPASNPDTEDMRLFQTPVTLKRVR